MSMRNLGVLLLFVTTACGSAYAQESASSPDDIAVIPVETVESEDPPPTVPVFEEIVVTATRREALARNLPQSLSTLLGTKLEASGAGSLKDFIPTIPGVALTEMQPDLFRISIRGIQTDVGATTPQATGIFIDDVPLNDRFLLHSNPDLPPFDLEGIEILKGPQGTLFGGSALAGAVRYRIRDAVPGATELRAYGQYQSIADGSPALAQGAAGNMPLGQDAGLRLVAVRRETGGTIDDRRNGEADTDKTGGFSGRALLRWNLADRFSIGLKGFTQETDAADVPLAETTDGEFTRERALRKSPSKTEASFGALDLRYRMDWAELVSTTSVLRKQGTFANAYAERVLGTEDTGQGVDAPTGENIDGAAQELRLVSPAAGERWEWLLGIFADRYHFIGQQQIFTKDPLGNDVVLLDFDADVRARERAMFGELSRAFGERWKATVGLRAYEVETEGTVVSSGAIILATGSPENRNDADIKARGVSPKVAVQYVVNDGIQVYATAARGFRFGGVQLFGPSPASPNVPPTYDPDSLWSYELGGRTAWLGGLLQVDVAAFYIDWSDPQVQTTTGGAVPLNTIDNVGGARSYGTEGALRCLTPIDGLTARLSGAYTNARTTEPYTAPSGTVVPAGARLPGSAAHQVFAGLDYELSWGAFLVATTASHAVFGRGVSDIEQSMKTYDYHSTDVNVSFANSAWPGRPRIALGATNLEDNRAVVAAFVEDASNFTTVYNRSRTLLARLDLQF